MTIEAIYILFLYPPTVEGPFSAKIGMGIDGTTTEANMEITLSNCTSFDDVIRKTDEILSTLNISKYTDFVLVYPPFQSQTDQLTQRVIERSWQINEMAMVNGWRFDRKVPFFQPQNKS